MKLDARILNLVMMVQSHFKAVQDENMFYGTINRNDMIKDAFEDTEKFYNSIDKEILHSIGLKANKISFNKVLKYYVTCDMTATLYEDLGKFIF
jgi:DNA mismatch repair ATPase MutS